MPIVYEPGMPNPYFTKHKFYGIPVYGNMKPLEDCKLKGYVRMNAQAYRGIASELLSPEYLWATFQAEAEDLLKVSGKWIEDHKERNRRINAAYAKLWLADNRFQWAGLAAFASKQVGCGLLHAADIVADNRRQRERIQRSFAQAGVSGAEAATLIHMGTEVGGYKMYKRLGHGNMHLFLDIYPLHRFYMERGWKEFDACLEKRQNKRYPVYWDVDRAVLPFATPFREIRAGFGHMETGNVAKSVEALARHEQVNILQAIMYNDGVMQGMLAMNQLAWATGFPTGDYQEIQLTLSAQCRAKTSFTSWFASDKYAKLWVVEERMRFVNRAAERFDVLLNSPHRRQVEESIRAIAAGGGVE